MRPAPITCLTTMFLGFVIVFCAVKSCNGQGLRDLVQAKSDMQAQRGQLAHLGGFVNGREGVGMGPTRLSAIANACGPMLGRIRTATRGSDGNWYATTQPRRLFRR